MQDSKKNPIIPALESVGVELIRKYFRRVREYHRAYREGKSGGVEVESAIKTFKSHRRVPEQKVFREVLFLQLFSVTNNVLISEV